MRNSWPLGILIAFILFAGFMTGFAVYSSQHPPELVADNYFALDAEYEARQRQRDNWDRLADSLVPAVWLPDSLCLFVPPSLLDADSGRVTFYKPDHRALDFEWDWSELCESNGRIAADRLAPGRWTIYLNAWKDGTGYSHSYQIARP